MPLNLAIPLYAPGTNAAPTTTFLTDIGARIDSYQHSITATGGFESMSVTLVTTFDDAVDMLINWLMRSTVVTDPDGRIMWEGALVGITAQVGQESRSISMDAVANRMRVRYTTVLSTPGTTAQVSDATSIARYGTKDGVVSVGTTTATAAANLAAAVLAARKNPLAQPSTSIKTGAMGNVQVTLTFAGWYHMLDWVLTSSTSTNTTGIVTQVQNLLTSYTAVNAYISSDYRLMIGAGVSDTETINTDTPYTSKIEDLLRQGNSSGQRLAWGVYEGRQFVVNQWAGATPSTIDYVRYLGESAVYTPTGGIVDPWMVRPDAMYQVQDILDVAPVGTSPDTAARFYVERVTCSISQHEVSVSLEPSNTTAIDSMIAVLK